MRIILLILISFSLECSQSFISEVPYAIRNLNLSANSQYNFSKSRHTIDNRIVSVITENDTIVFASTTCSWIYNQNCDILLQIFSNKFELLKQRIFGTIQDDAVTGMIETFDSNFLIIISNFTIGSYCNFEPFLGVYKVDSSLHILRYTEFNLQSIHSDNCLSFTIEFEIKKSFMILYQISSSVIEYLEINEGIDHIISNVKEENLDNGCSPSAYSSFLIRKCFLCWKSSEYLFLFRNVQR